MRRGAIKQNTHQSCFVPREISNVFASIDFLINVRYQYRFKCDRIQPTDWNNTWIFRINLSIAQCKYFFYGKQLLP